MEKTSRKVNAKAFLHDFREGRSDEELMRLHSLTPGTLAKLLRVLLERKLLDPSELKSRRASAPTEPEIRIPPHRPRNISPEEPVRVARPPERVQDTGSSCPQCGAHVTERMLSCPECGHVLPGEERWEAVEPKKGLFERIPARALGYIVALPIGIMLFFLFKDVLLPMFEATTEKRSEALRKETPLGKTPLQASKDLARQAVRGIIQLETQRLTDDGVLSGADDNYRTFTAGSRWSGMSDDEKHKALEDIRTALRRSSLPLHFKLVNESGASIALVTDQSIELLEGSSVTDSAVGGSETGAGPAPSSARRNLLDRLPKYRGK